ncbi:hypothetical protein DO72_5947 [Burkholderia pseudomallei]|nr:hypothetical protein DO72_5947 [Burkholderia pseudomallei]KGS32328.1 hypothetical protein X962_6421 [Burkholderia pseudomallei MSHR7343]KGS48725.1 hypothetical protein X945_6371 [Burkholderia pseudomallei ABCPW 107]KGX79074.1 hypothetical protein Y033_5039 [Burkholderia pseudomallei MSHR435]
MKFTKRRYETSYLAVRGYIRIDRVGLDVHRDGAALSLLASNGTGDAGHGG